MKATPGSVIIVDDHDHLPVVVVSAVDDLESVVKCIELGADDYLFKSFNKILLKARVSACLEKKRLRDQEQQYLQAIQAEQEKAERLLRNILLVGRYRKHSQPYGIA